MRKAIALGTLALLLAAGAAQAELQTMTFTQTPNMVIPDASGPVESDMEIDLAHYITDIRVYIAVDITDWSSDLRIWVESAYDTRVELFFIGEGGEPATDPAGWYPTDFTPHEDMTQWIGEGADGTWTIICQDLSEDAEGVLTEWRVEITYDDAVSADVPTWSEVKALFD
jgi:subtilisin-like proprotein convertase family protein